MKNLFKFWFLIGVVSLSSIACNPNKAAEKNTDTASTDTAFVKPVKKKKVDDEPRAGCD